MSKAEIGEEMRRRVLDVLRPLAKGADQADKRAAEHKRLGAGDISGNASTGLGVTFDHLRAARDLLHELGGEP